MAPVLSTNSGIWVDEGNLVTITSAMLQVSDPVNTPAQLTYTLSSLPIQGVLQLNGTALTLNGTFTQDDINNSRVTYVSDGSETTSDGFSFTFSNGEGFSDEGAFTTSRVTGGVEGNSDSFAPSISADGRYVTFVSWASNLVGGDTNDRWDVFVYDRETLTTSRVSVGPGGVEGNSDSFAPSISADGRYVTFWSVASNLVSGDTNGTADIFVYDRETLTTSRVSVGAGGVQGNSESNAPSISADGRYVTFISDASNLVGGDTNGTADIFVYDRETLTTSHVSVGLGGVQSNGSSNAPSISADGRYVTFVPWASNLVSGDTNDTIDIFVYDRETLTTSRVSVGTGGVQGNSYSYAPSISADGRYVTFESRASNLVSGDTNGTADIFVYDRETLTTSRVSVGTGGVQGNSYSESPSISADGRYVTFSSDASNLVSGDTNYTRDVFVYDRQTNTTSRVSVVPGSVEGNNVSFEPSISADGRHVTFVSSASNLVSGDTNASWDIFVSSISEFFASTTINVNPVNDAPTLASAIPNQTAIEHGVFTFQFAANTFSDVDVNDTLSYTATLNDGNPLPSWLSFNASTRTFSGTPIINNTSNLSIKVTATDAAGATAHTSFNLEIADANDPPVLSTNSGISVNEGGTVTITSAMLQVSDPDNTPAQLTYTLSSLPIQGVLQLNGTALALNGTFTQDDINNSRVTYVSDGSETTSDGFSFTFSDGENTLITRAFTTSRVSIGAGGVEGNSSSYAPSISADGRYVTFESYASNLVSGDTSYTRDIFVYDTETNTTSRVSVGAGGVEGNDYSFAPSISADGRHVTFVSRASNLVSGDTNASGDVFVYDRETNTTSRVSVGAGGVEGNGSSFDPSISADGRYVTFESRASNLVSGDTNNTRDIFVYDRQTNTTSRVSVGLGGVEGNSDSFAPSISADGRYVTFWSDASNLVSGDTNSKWDVFVYDTETNTTSRVSVGAGGVQGNSESNAPSISADGRYVTFMSYASNLVSGDTNNTGDVFVYDRETNTTSRVSVGAGGVEGNNSSSTPSISADGRYVTFDSYASNLVSGDTNYTMDVFVHDRQTNTTSSVSVGSGSVEGNDYSFNPSISADGRHVTFVSTASNLVSGDTNASGDVFVFSSSEFFASTTINVNNLNVITGTDANEFFAATNEIDNIDAAAGTDKITATLADLQPDDTFKGGIGTDTFILSAGSSSDTVSIDAANLTNQLLGMPSTSLLNFEKFDFRGFAGTTNFIGSADNDWIISGQSADTLRGSEGNDNLAGGAGFDSINGGAGNDTIEAGAGWDTINGGEGNDNLIGGNGNDTIESGIGNDTLNGGIGSDTLSGADGNDTYIIDSDDMIAGEMSNGGTDTVRADFSYTLAAYMENLTLTGDGAINGIGNTLNNIIAGNSASNSLFGDAGNDNLNGGADDDFLDGGIGNDNLNGGAGGDILNGGDGNDTYTIDTDDIITGEMSSGGTDTVRADFSYTLAAYMENLTLTGTAINGTGNTLNNSITGNSVSNSLFGDAGNDTLNGGAGIDTLSGGDGNDTYIADSDDLITGETSISGTDSVVSSSSYTLGAYVENLTLTGTAAIDGTGNTLDNTIAGNSASNSLFGDAGNDTLNGGVGSDILNAGDGNDTYIVDSNDAIAGETSISGTDTVIASATYVLGDYLENLNLSGNTAINGIGNALANTIQGNNGSNLILGSDGDDMLDGSIGNDSLSGGNGDDLLAGGAGNDSLTGSAGNDQFLYNTNAAFVASAIGVDTIADFTASVDKLVLDQTTFSSLTSLAGNGFSSVAEFATVTTDASVATSSALIVYNSTNGKLFYNQNGMTAGFGTGSQFATLTAAPGLTAADFLIQA